MKQKVRKDRILSRKTKIRKIFDPNAIKTEIALALSCDLHSPLHVYGGHSSIHDLFRSRQETEFLHKYVDPSVSQDHLVDLTFSKFEKINSHMAKFRDGFYPFPENAVRPQTRFSDLDNILIRARALMHSVLTPFLEDELFHYCKHGSGTSIGVPFRDTSLEAKSSFPISITVDAIPLFDRYLLFDSSLNSAMLYHSRLLPTGKKYDVVEGSRATTVEKTDRIRRMIAVEPTGNMFLQQGLMEMMYDRMRKVFLNVETLPEHHQKRARAASITSKEATIDWSSASDCVSIDLLRWLLPPKWFDMCEQVRCPRMSLNGVFEDLNMFSTMGNAVTFPLETLVFWTMAHATRLQRLGTLSSFPEWKDLRKCSVFGDDCIVPTEDALSFIRVMERFGFIVNDEKSFYGNEGFRESCGGDYLHGIDVRPFKLKGPHNISISSLEPWLYTFANALLEKYILYFGELTYVYDKELFKSLFSIFRQYNIAIKLVPDDFPDDAGLKISSDICRFYSCYTMNLCDIAVNDHGLYTFRYCNFRYAVPQRARVDDLHYAKWLKTHVFRLGPPRPERKKVKNPKWITKRKGGYVVARGYTCQWYVPPLQL